MSLLSKWGFSRSERSAIVVLIFALLLGMGISYLRQRAHSQEVKSLTPEDSILIFKLTQYTRSIQDTSQADSVLQNDKNVSIKKAVQYPININTASVEELIELPGIGPVLARRIVEYREQYGPFTSPDSLINVKGIGQVKLSKIKNKITIEIPRREN